MSGSLISVDKLIREVKKLPSIWHVHHTDYTDKAYKMAAWKKICHVFYPSTVPNTTDETRKVSFMQKKWKSVRDYYTKQRKEMHGDTPTGFKRRKYVYFDMLQFLEANFQNPYESSESDPLDAASTTTKKEETVQYDNFDPSEDRKDLVKLEEIDIDDDSSQIFEKEFDQTPAATSTRRRSEIDEDEMFLLSLLPSIRTLTALQKMDFKLAVMTALKRIQFSDSSQ